MKRTIRLNEYDLHNIVSTSLRRVLNEGEVGADEWGIPENRYCYGNFIEDLTQINNKSEEIVTILERMSSETNQNTKNAAKLLTHLFNEFRAKLNGVIKLWSEPSDEPINISNL